MFCVQWTHVFGIEVVGNIKLDQFKLFFLDYYNLVYITMHALSMKSTRIFAKDIAEAFTG